MSKVQTIDASGNTSGTGGETVDLGWSFFICRACFLVPAVVLLVSFVRRYHCLRCLAGKANTRRLCIQNKLSSPLAMGKADTGVTPTHSRSKIVRWGGLTLGQFVYFCLCVNIGRGSVSVTLLRQVIINEGMLLNHSPECAGNIRTANN